VIVVDTSVFLDELFQFEKARLLFRLIQNGEIPIVEPELFKIELIGQLVRRMKQTEATVLFDSVITRLKFVRLNELEDLAFSVALATGSRAIDSFFIAASNLKTAFLISNDKLQVRSAHKFGVEVYYLLDEFEKVKERLQSLI
jgi:predicted nucleic acid-binding protein